jgi:4-amino-4-deoxy-L-arabinose transferase-like glycosyltransferase
MPLPWSRLDWLLLTLVTLVGAALRFYQLGTVPPGFQFDEAFNAIDATQVLHGNFPLFLPANAGREVLYTYFQAGLVALLGASPYTFRLASALLGVATIPTTYLLLRRLLQRDSRRVAAFTSLALAVSLWHIHFSHYGIRVITMPLLFCALFGSYWMGCFAATRHRRLAAFVLAGLFAGLAVWTNPTGRIAPFAIIAFTAWLRWRHRSGELHLRRRASDGPLGGLLITGGVALLVFSPLGLEFYRHPEWFSGHAAEVSIFAERVSGGSPWWMLLTNIGRVLGMFSISGDVEWAHGPAGRPIFDPLLSIPFVIGVALWLVRLWRRGRNDPDVDALALLACWSIVMLAPSVFSEAAPNYSRTLPALPALMVATGLGLTWIASWDGRWSTAGLWSASLMLAISGGITFYDYFVRFPQRPEVYFAYEANKLDALEQLEQQAEDYEIYLHPLWAEHPPVRIRRNSDQVKALETSDTLVLPPSGKGLILAYPPELVGEAERMAQFWPGTMVERIPDRFGGLLYAQVRLAADQVAGWPPMLQPTVTLEARFEDAPTLLGMAANASGDEIWLFWRAEPRATVRDLTTFIHLLGPDGNRIGQADERPGNGLYPTNVWTPGERIIERYHPGISDLCEAGNEVALVVGWYELAAAGARRPRADAEGDSVAAGVIRLPVVGQPRDAFAPAHLVERALSPGLHLIGYDLHGEPAQAGAPLTIDLFLQRGDGPPVSQLALHLTSGQRNHPLGERQLAGAGWQAGEVICQRIRTVIPGDSPAADYQLAIEADGVLTPFASLSLTP